MRYEIKTPATRSAPKYATFVGLALYLILTFLWRAFATANEYDRPAVIFITIAFDLLCLIGLVAVRVQIKRALGEQPLPGWLQVLFVVALLAGIGLFAIRFTSGASWATGHLHYDCCPLR